MCVILLDMKSVSIREVQHHLSKVLAWVDQGDEVQITRRNRPVAKIVPPDAPPTRGALPAFTQRARQIWDDHRETETLSRTIVSSREERV